MEILSKILLIFIVPIFVIVLGLLYKGIDRILVARMQRRVGPPVLQPFWDVKKLLIKENVVPENAVKWLFNLMPIVALMSIIMIILYLPLGMTPLLEGYGDAILVIYLLIIPSLALILGGFASSSPYAGIGAQREMVKMMSFEFPLAITIISIAWLLYSFNIPNVFSFATIAANPVWNLVGPLGFIGLAVIFLTLLLVMPGELGVVPFDVSEAGSEIADGILVEYSGRNMALFYLAGAVKMIAVASLVIALFLPYNISSLFTFAQFGISNIPASLIDIVFYLVKLFCIIFIGSTLARVTASRFKIDQVVTVYWKYSVIISLVGLLLIGLDIML